MGKTRPRERTHGTSLPFSSVRDSLRRLADGRLGGRPESSGEARYPNEDPTHPYSGGWVYVDGVRPPMYQDIEGERTDTVVLRAKDARGWSRPQDREVCIFPRYNWWNRIERIAAYDPSTRTVTLAARMQCAARPEDRFGVPIFSADGEDL